MSVLAEELKKQGFTDADLELILGLSTAEDRKGLFDRETELANALRGGGPQGRNVGGTYVASHPLEHAADAFLKYQLYKKGMEGVENQRDIISEQGRARQAYALGGVGGQPMNPNMTTPYQDELRKAQLLRRQGGY